MAFSPDGRWLVTNWEGHALHLWPLPPTSESPGRRLEVRAIQWRAFAVDPRGRFVAAVGQPDHAWIVPLDGSPARRLWTPASDCLLHAVAVSPSGRLVATAWYFGGGARTLRVVDLETGALRTFPLTPAPHGAEDPVGGYTGSVTSLAFDGESVVYTAGLGGMRRWNLRDGARRDVGAAATQRHPYASMTGDRRTAFVTTQNVDGSTPCSAVERLDLASASRSTPPEFGDCPSLWGPHGAGDVLVVGQRDGTIRVGRIGSGQPHILAAREAAVAEVAVSPDLRWVASSGEDNTLRLWPMPDLSRPPLHTWPPGELLAKLKSLTNLRAVRDPKSSTGWSIAREPFPGWKDVPEW